MIESKNFESCITDINRLFDVGQVHWQALDNLNWDITGFRLFEQFQHQINNIFFTKEAKQWLWKSVFQKGYSKKVSLFFSPHNWNSVISRILSMIISLFLSGSSSKHSTRSSYISLISLELQKEEIEDTEGCRDQMKAFRLFVFWALLWYLCKYID